MTPREIAESCSFWKDARENALLTEEQLIRCLESVPENKREPEKIDNRLARVSIHLGYLTLWQAQRILTRRAGTLRIDKYILTDSLGQGGMGRVFLARDTRLQRSVALKVLNPDKLNHERALARFQREALVGGQLQHENLVRVYDVGVHQHSPYLVMEYIEGPTVSELIAREGRLAIPVSARIGRDVALGLNHLAEKKLVHRDVNPRNILIDKEGRAKLTDLGLAIFEEQLSQVTTEGSTVGTFDYISPEQARHSRGVDIRSDIYSLGCSIYHMISGHPPFPEGNLAEKIYSHQIREAEPLVDLVPGVSREMSDLVRKCLRKLPDERFASARELADLLARFVTEESLASTIELNRSATVEVASDSSASKAEPIDSRPTSGSAEGDPDHPPENLGNHSSGIRNQEESLQLDLGIDSLELPYRAEPSRSSSLDPGPLKPIDRTWARILLGAAGVCALLVFVFRGMIVSRPGSGGVQVNPRPVVTNTPTPSTGSTESPRAETSLASGAISVIFQDGQASSFGSIEEALRTAMGQSAEIRIPQRDEPWIWKVMDSRPIAGSRWKIVGVGSEKPRVVVDLAEAKSGLLVRADSVLEIAKIEIAPKNARPTGPMLSAFGDVTLSETDWKSTAGQTLPKSVILAGSRTLTIRSCWFSGFPIVVDAKILPETRIDLKSSYFIGSGSASDSADNSGKLASLLLRLEVPRWSVDKATLTIDGCVFAGTDLIGLAGQNPAPGIRMDSKRSIYAGDRLFVFEPNFTESFRKAKWSGTQNVFSDGIVFWPRGPGADACETLEAWRMMASETGSSTRKLAQISQLNGMSTPEELSKRLGLADRLDGLSAEGKP